MKSALFIDCQGVQLILIFKHLDKPPIIVVFVEIALNRKQEARRRMVTITCDRCGIDMTDEFAKKLSDLNKKGDRDRFDKIGWMIAMAVVFNVRLNRPFLFCKKCTGIRGLEELGQEKVIDYDRLNLFRDWKDSNKD